MKKSCLATLSGLALGGAVIISVPYAWSQAGEPGSGAAPSPGQGKAEPSAEADRSPDGQRSTKRLSAVGDDAW